jgi:FKBP-type peptidyl-prolyl cis-trans isomerase
MRKIAAAFALAALLGSCGQPSVNSEIEKQEKASAADTAKAQAAAAAFLAQNKVKPGVVVTASGLQYQVVRKGDPKLPTPAPVDEVTVMYEGALTDGKIFDSSYARNEPASFAVGGVIPGWTEALQLMRPGDEFRLVIPPAIGYAGEEQPGIPPNSVLVFRVELLGIKRPDGTVVAAKPVK